MSNLKDVDVKQLIDKNFMFLTMLGYATSIIFSLQSIIDDNSGCYEEKILDQIEWLKVAIENIVYKNIAPPIMP